jgi:hypothetical protein
VSGFSTWHSLRTVLRHIARNIGARADFIISTGDLVEDSSEAAYQAALQALNARNTLSAAPGPVFISAEGLREFPLYLLPGANLLIYLALNGYLLGREYFELAAVPPGIVPVNMPSPPMLSPCVPLSYIGTVDSALYITR